ncbi:hypothetical protein MM5_207 [Morganella phage vB_Mm5]
MYHGIELFENMLAYEHKSDLEPYTRGMIAAVRNCAFGNGDSKSLIFSHIFNNSRNYYELFYQFKSISRDTHTVSDLVEYLKSGDVDNRYSFSLYTNPVHKHNDCILSIKIDDVVNPDSQFEHTIYNFIVNKNDASKINPSFLSHDVCGVYKDDRFLNLYTDSDFVKFVISCYTRSKTSISINDIKNLDMFVNQNPPEIGHESTYSI